MSKKNPKKFAVDIETAHRAQTLHHTVCAMLCKKLTLQAYISFLIEQGIEHLDGEIKLYQERNKQT